MHIERRRNFRLLHAGAALRFGVSAAVFALLTAALPVRVAAACAVGLALVAGAVASRHQATGRATLAGLAVVLLCALVATATGTARDFFLLPMLAPPAALVLCLASLARGRPLVGVVVNPAVRGPPDWPDWPRLRRIYRDATWWCVAISLLNGTTQLAFYLRDLPAALGAVHAASGPVFGAVAAIAGLRARQAISPAGSHV